MVEIKINLDDEVVKSLNSMVLYKNNKKMSLDEKIQDAINAYINEYELMLDQMIEYNENLE